MKIEIPDEVVDLLMDEELTRVIASSQEVIDDLGTVEKLEHYQKLDLDYYRCLREAAQVVRLHYRVNE